jgi:hypothetical protein
MIPRNGLFYFEIIRRMKYLEEREHKQYLKFIRIVDNYQHKYNKSIFE